MISAYCFLGVAVIVLAPTAIGTGRLIYRSVTVDRNGQLHIVLESGKEIMPPRIRGQKSFDEPAISPDGRTVGWIAVWRNQNPNFTDLPLELVIYRTGHILRRIRGGFFWDWRFEADGKQVAYSTGPQHGGAAVCLLLDVNSGREIAVWQVTGETDPPDWAAPLRRF